MTYFVKDRTVMEGGSNTQVGVFPTKAQANLFVRSMVGCVDAANVDFETCEKIANKIALLEDTHRRMSDGSWVLLSID